MRMVYRSFLTVATLAALAGCGSDGSRPESDAASRPSNRAAPASGTVVVSGSSTVFRISRAAQISYHKQFGDGVKILVDNRGTGGGFGRYLEGEVDMVDASRAAKPEEESQAREKGLEWTRFLVGYDGITVVVNPRNTFVKSLTVAQLKRLFEPNSTVRSWKELDPSWPDRKILLYTPDNDSGTYEFFCEAVIGAKAQRKDVQASPDDNILVQGVASDEDGLGYFGYAYYAANAQRLRAVPIQNGDAGPAVAPSPETILNQTYQPLARPLYLYVKNQAMKRPEVASFLRFYIEKINDLATQAKYVPPTEEDQKANLAALPPAAP